MENGKKRKGIDDIGKCLYRRSAWEYVQSKKLMNQFSGNREFQIYQKWNVMKMLMFKLHWNQEPAGQKLGHGGIVVCWLKRCAWRFELLSIQIETQKMRISLIPLKMNMFLRLFIDGAMLFEKIEDFNFPPKMKCDIRWRCTIFFLPHRI